MIVLFVLTTKSLEETFSKSNDAMVFSPILPIAILSSPVIAILPLSNITFELTWFDVNNDIILSTVWV